MLKTAFYLPALLLVLQPFITGAQAGAPVNNSFKTEQERFIRQLKNSSIDSAIVSPLSRHFESEVEGIYASIIADTAGAFAGKEKAVRSLVYFMRELGNNIERQKSDVYDIPGALQSYKSLLKALVYHQRFYQIMVALQPRRSQLLATTFSQYNEYPLLDDIAVYKRMAASPQYILQFLENKPGFRYADSLLLIAAAYQPLKFISYLNTGKPDLQDKIRNAKNIYLQQIISLSGDKDIAELLPFAKQLAEQQITRDEILATRTDAINYFQLLVNTMMASPHSNDSSILTKPLRDGLKQKSLAFYVSRINELHEAADAARFVSVKGLRPEDLYYIMTSGAEELYTSSYLGLYKRLMEYFKPQSADSLFLRVGYDNFPIFMQLAANYNVLTDFLGNMPMERANELLHQFISGIGNDPNSDLNRAMDIADLFTGLDSAVDIAAVVQRELQSNLNRCRSGQQYAGMRLYSILLQVFDLATHKDAANKLWAKLGNYEMLKKTELENKSGEITQLVLFYGDDDGITSFNNFLKLYTDKIRWEVSKNENWINIRSLSGQPLVIFANMPLDSKEEMDLKAQDSLILYLTQQSIEPSVLIHRGHSYHLDNTLKRLTPSVKLAILGSCGGYNKAISIDSISPDVQIIASKKTGSKSINDPLINVINETLLEGNDLVWSGIWGKLAERFSKDQLATILFSEYFSPDKNLSLFVLKLFNR